MKPATLKQANVLMLKIRHMEEAVARERVTHQIDKETLPAEFRSRQYEEAKRYLTDTLKQLQTEFEKL